MVLLFTGIHKLSFNETPSHPIRRDVCGGIDARPIMYHEYHEDECPAANHLNSDGLCGGWRRSSADAQCTAFCQMRKFVPLLLTIHPSYIRVTPSLTWGYSGTSFEWAQETPFPNSDCHWPVKCSLSPGDLTSWDWDWGGISVHPEIKYALESGISGGYGESHGTSTGHSLSLDPPEGQCGYFTFVPVRKITWYITQTSLGTPADSCRGTLTEARDVFINHERVCWFLKNTKNYGASQVSYVNGVPDGRVLFIWTDCLTRERLGPEFQHPIYSGMSSPIIFPCSPATRALLAAGF